MKKKRFTQERNSFAVCVRGGIIRDKNGTQRKGTFNTIVIYIHRHTNLFRGNNDECERKNW